ncbi:MAG TPA: iron-sulfur cluster assembly scaffold protein [Terriglobales bacterium]
MYSSQLLDYFEHPRNAGLVQSPDATVQTENPVCGDVLKLTAKFSEGRITDVKFLAKGCVPAMACGSAIAEFLQGKTAEEAITFRRDDLIRIVGGLPEASTHASQLAMDAVASLLKKLTNLKT